MDYSFVSYGILLLYIIGTVWFGFHVKNKDKHEDQEQTAPKEELLKEKLTDEQYRLAIILLIINPIIGGFILYKILNKKFPAKAKQLNHISMIVFLVEIVIGVGLGLAYARYLHEPVQIREKSDDKQISRSLDNGTEPTKNEIMDVIIFIMEEVVPVFDEGDVFYMEGMTLFDNNQYDEAADQFSLAKEKYAEGLAVHDEYEYPETFEEFDTLLHDGITMANEAMDLFMKSIEIKNKKALEEAVGLDGESSDMVQDAYDILDEYAEEISTSDALLYSIFE